MCTSALLLAHTSTATERWELAFRDIRVSHFNPKPHALPPPQWSCGLRAGKGAAGEQGVEGNPHVCVQCADFTNYSFD